ncbi:MAG: flavin-containing monooxygenase [Panacagrimonas sp.]
MQFDAIIVGAGIAGMYAIYKLRQLGMKIKCIETGTDVGGTWYWNRYPGARVDSEAYIYHYWFDKQLESKWQWSERFPAQPETERYLQFIADACDLRKDIQFSTTVTSATWDEGRQRWTVETDGGDVYDTQFYVSCGGMLSANAALMGQFEGEQDFNGKILYTARWPRENIDYKGKKVGVVGTGATGIQVIQTIAPQCDDLKVFMRTPQFITPMRNPKYTADDNKRFIDQFDQMKQRVKNTFSGFDYDFEGKPFAETTREERLARYERLWADGSLSFWLTGYTESFFDESVNQEVTDWVSERMRERIKDPALCEQLIPTTYGFGTHRVPLETRYLEAYLLPQTQIVPVKDNPIKRILPQGLELADGSVHALDILIFATGFDAGSGALSKQNVKGRGGRSLTEEWKREIRTTMGLQIHGYPNLFATATPLSPSAALCNMTTCLQTQVDWISDAIAHMRANGRSVMEPSAQAEEAWVQHHEETSGMTLFVKTDSWYVGSNVEGKPRRMLSYCGGVGEYHRRIDEVRDKGYEGFTID